MNPLGPALGTSEKTGEISSRQQELERMSKDALVQLLLQSEGEWSGRTLPFHQPAVSRSFSLDVPWEADEFLTLPAHGAGEGSRAAQAAWRIILVSFDLSHPVVGVEVCGEVVIGRASGDTRPDLDLAAFSAGAYGVSRRHALLRPDDEALWLVDLESTNGTFANGATVKPSQPYALEDHDIISLGRLQFQARVQQKAR